MNEHEGLAIGHQMAKVAADHAGESWTDEAYEAFRQHAINNLIFTTEDVRRANLEMPPPPDSRAWGAIALRAKKDNLIQFNDWVRSENRITHGRLITRWKSLIYKYENNPWNLEGIDKEIFTRWMEHKKQKDGQD